MPNGTYDLLLTVHGGGGESNAWVRFRLESNLKIGQFSFSEQDLVLPVNGIPLTVTRTYNSLNPRSGDFGYSWTMALNAMDIQLDDQRQAVTIGTDSAPFADDEEDDNGLPKVVSIRTGGGWDVTLTLPDGRRTTFAFGTYGVWPELYAKWTPPPDIHATLEVIGDNRILFGVGGFSVPTWADSDFTLGKAPLENQDLQGWVLQTADGTRYYITRGTPNNVAWDNSGNGSGTYVNVRAYGPPKVTSIVQRTGDRIEITDDGLKHYDPSNHLTRSTFFTRDQQGRITEISDPISGSNGLAVVRYVYNRDSGNLIQVLKLTDRTAGAYVTNKYHYDNPNFPHYLTSIDSPLGVPIARNEYDDSGRLTAVVDADGNRTEFRHDTTNRVEVVIDRLGRTNSHAYDVRGNVTASTNALGGIILMDYDDLNNKTNEVQFMNGQPYATNSFAFDGRGLLLTAVNALGFSNMYSYNANGQILISTDARNNSSTNFYDDSTGSLIATADARGNATTNYFNNRNLLAGSRDPLGTLTTNVYDDVENLIGTATMSASGIILSTNSFVYDSAGNRTNSTVWRRVNGSWTAAVTIYIFDGRNRVVQTVDPDGGTNTIVYNALGKREAAIGKAGRATTYEYDVQGRLFRTTYADLTTEILFYDAAGNRTNSVDRAGRTTLYIYDALNRLAQTIRPDNTTNWTVYDDLGRVRFTVDARQATNAFGHDLVGRTAAMTNAWGTSLAVVSLYGFDANRNQIYVTNALGAVTTNVFDVLDRQVQTLYPDGTKVSSGFDAAGQRLARTNQDSIVTLFGYDGAGKLTSVTNAFGKPEQTITRYEYDEAGNLIHQIDALNRTNSFAYDELARRIAHWTPDTNLVERYGYDLAGNLTRYTNFNGVVITNEYDVLNRLTNRTSINGYQTGFGYSPIGQRTNMTDASGVTSYSYDNCDRLTNKVVSWTGGPTLSLNYRFDANGNLTSLWSSSPGGVTNFYQCDALNRLTNVLANGSPAASYGFDAVGSLQGMRYGNGVTNQFQYDSLNRLTNLLWKLNAGTLASFYYQLGLAGNRTNLSEAVNGTNRTCAWVFDSLYRLKQEALGGGTSGTLSYGFDLVGNRTNRTVTGALSLANQAFTFNTNDWLTSDGYDQNGSTTNSSGNSYQYDILNHLTNVNNGAVLITYDGDGNRVKKAVGGTTTYYLLDSRNPSGYIQVLEEWTASSGTTNLSRVYNYGLGLVSQRQPSVSTNYFIFDGHGSTRVLADIAGTVVNAFTFDAYGNLIASNIAPQTSYLYAGQQFDGDLGSYHLRARTYNPGTARFLTMDSYAGNQADPPSLHRYLYCGADPVNRIDPTGNTWLEAAANGRLVHKKIGEHFEQSGPGRFSNRWISTILGLDLTMIPLLPDLTDWENHEIYEIKPLLEYPVGLLQLAGYLAVFNYFDKDNHWGPGNKYNYMPPTRIELGLGAYALVNAPDAGVITYDVVDWPARALVTIGVIATADVWTGVLAATLTGVMGVL